jgi:hypothetical protein
MTIHFTKAVNLEYIEELYKKKYIWIAISDSGWEVFSYDFANKLVDFIKENISNSEITVIDHLGAYKKIFLSFKNKEDQDLFLLTASGGMDIV